MPYEICLNEDEKEFKLPLTQFCDSLMFWKMVSKLSLFFIKKRLAIKGRL